MLKIAKKRIMRVWLPPENALRNSKKTPKIQRVVQRKRGGLARHRSVMKFFCFLSKGDKKLRQKPEFEALMVHARW